MDEAARRGNLRFIGVILGITAIVLAVFAVAAYAGWAPLSPAAREAAAIVLGATALVEGLTACFFLVRYK